MLDQGCCETFKRIADCIKVCTSSDTLSTESSSMMLNERIAKSQNLEISPSVPGFRSDIMLTAQNVLALPTRKLPLVACIIGHSVRAERNLAEDEDRDDSHAYAKKNRTKKNKKTGTPHVYYWDSGKNKLIPLLPLTKVDQGPIEALGYSVISKGMFH